MFFTIIIPAYNCEETINRLLDSIKDQDTDDLKVIIVDDSYEDGHTDLVEYIRPYRKHFQFSYYKRESEPYTIHCPGNTRHSGLKRAMVEDTSYILFADCDDQFIPNTFQMLKDRLIQANCPAVAGTRFDVHDFDGAFKYKEQNSLGWLHGKLYRKDFLQRHGIQFKVDMAAHEDTYFNCLVTYYELIDHFNAFRIDDLTFYIWHEQRTSITHGYDGVRNIFIQEHFEDYCDSIIRVYLDRFTQDGITDPAMKRNVALRVAFSVYMAYCYFQSFADRGKLEWLRNSYNVFREQLWDYYNTLNVTKEELVNYVYSNPKTFIDHRNVSYNAVGYYMEKESFRDFIMNMNFFR